MIKRTAEKLPIEQKTIQTVLTSMISLILNMDPMGQHQEERPKSSKYILIQNQLRFFTDMQIMYLYITTQNVRLNTVLCVRNCLCTFTNLIINIFCAGAGERLLVIMFLVLSSHHQRKYHFKHKNCLCS